MADREIHVPQNVFNHLFQGYLRDEGRDLARNYQQGGLAHPGDAFGAVFAWCWEHDQDRAVQALAEMLLEARKHCEPHDRIRLRNLLDDLRFALHRTEHAREYEYSLIKERAQAEVPKWFGEADPNE